MRVVLFLVFVVLAVVLLVGIAGFPWVYWEVARLVMRDEAPLSVAWLVPKPSAHLIWWGMGITLVVWAPLALLLGASVLYVVVTIGLARSFAKSPPKLSQLATRARQRALARVRKRPITGQGTSTESSRREAQ